MSTPCGSRRQGRRSLPASSRSEARSPPPPFEKGGPGGISVLALLGALIAGSCSSPPPAELTLDARAGATVAATLAGGESRRLRLELQAGQLADLAIEQDGIDLVATLLAPDGERLRAVDSPNGGHGGEPVPILATRAGAYAVEVRSLAADAPPGRFRAVLAALRPATANDRERVVAEDALARAAAGTAPGPYDDVVAAFRALGDEERAGDALFLKALVLASAGELSTAAAVYEESLAAFTASGATAKAGNALHNLGRARWRQGDPRGAVAAYSQALALHRRAGDAEGEVATLANQAAAEASLGHVEPAFGHYEEALARAQELGWRRQEGDTLASLGSLYAGLGEHELALDLFREAMPLLAASGAERQLAVTLGRSAAAKVWLGDDSVLADLERALAIQRRLGDRREEAVMLDYYGLACRRFGKWDEARRATREALELARELGDRWSEATALLHQGWLDERDGDDGRALASVDAARALFAAIGDAGGEASALADLARVRRRQGDLAAARQAVAAALDLVEAQRGAAESPGLRSSFFATRQSFYDLAVDLELAPGDPRASAEHAARALEIAERARARSLLDRLAGREAAPAAEPDAALAAQAEALATRLAAVGEEKLASTDPERRAALERAARRLTARAQRVDARLLLAEPRYAALAAGRPASAEEIRGLLGRDAVLLFYALGDERSHLWALTSTAIRAYELPPRREIDAAARRAWAALAQSHRRAGRGQAELALADLSRLLLAPAAAFLTAGTVAVVPDGAIAYLPFAALPDPADPDRPLAAEHAIVFLPSASALARLRAAAARRPVFREELAVVADPVFDAADPRLAGVRSADGPAPAKLPRLPFTAEEAAALRTLAGAERTRVLAGFDAGKAALLAADLSRARVLHFATHGVIDPGRPELSGLVLSRRDRQGRRQDGFLGTAEIARLDLAAELVTLAACDSALGKEVEGEGLVGLARGFMAAGAERVLVSLWRVDDRAGAALMERFYQGLLRDGLPASAALRRAQMEIRSTVTWSAPSYWAGFALYGDWR